MRRPAVALLALAAALPFGRAAVAQTGNEDDGAESDENPYTAPSAVPAPPSARAGPKLPVVEKDGMVRLPGGRFTLGSADRASPPNERPPHAVTLAPFWIDKTEVTVGAYRTCVDGHACARPAKSSAQCTYDLDDPELPVSCVRWQDADAYCRSLRKRLPHESEWEFAARGPYGYRYPWGGWRASCGYATTLLHDGTAKQCGPRPSRVGAHPSGASVFGVLDLSGNVEEWTADWYAEQYTGSAPRSGASHTLRGGEWLSPPGQERTTSRDWGSSLEAGPNVGFRCARDDVAP